MPSSRRPPKGHVPNRPTQASASRLERPAYKFFISLPVLLAFVLGFGATFYLATAVMRSVLQGPEAARAFLTNPWGCALEGEVMWALVIAAVGGAALAAVGQRVLVRLNLMSQDHANEMWKDG